MYSRALADKIKGRERRELSQERPIVGDTFKHEGDSVAGKTVAPRAISFMRSALWWLFVAAALFFIGAIFFFIYFFTFGVGSVPASPSNIDIGIAGPPQVPGGQSSELQIVVTNRNKIALELADLVINYPKGTRSPTDYVTELSSQRIPLGTIEPGGRRQGTVSAVFSGNEAAKAAVKVELEYHLSGSSAIFVASNNYTLTFSSAPVVVSVDGNTQTTSGQPIALTATVSSNSSAPVKDVLLSVDYPFGFKFQSANPDMIRSGLWALGDILPGQKRTVVLQGTLNGESADDRVFKFVAGTRKDPKNQAVDTALSDSTFHMTIAQPFLKLALSINKADSDPNKAIIVKPGENVNVSINWQNNLPVAVTDAVIVVRLSGLPIDGTTVHSIDGFYRSSDNSVYWDKTTTSGSLANLPPGSHGTVGFAFNMPGSDVLQSLNNPHLDVTVNAAGNRVSESGVPENLQSTARQKIALASDLQVVAQGLYYQSWFGGTGPMPPKADSETTYALVFTVNNTTNKVKGATIKAILPPYVRYVGRYSPVSENLVFNQSDGSVTWNIGSVEPGVGLNGVPPRQAAFAIGFTPSQSQIGQEPVLLQNIQFDGIDDTTGAEITRTVPDVTTNLASPSKSSSDISIGTDQGFTPANATVVK